MYKHWYKVLGIEGGGARGVFPLGVLSKIKHLLPQFDILIGTSTGGIIVLALAMGVDIDVIVRWYYERLPKIFSNSFLSKASRFFGLKKGIYSNENLIQSCKDFFGELKMKDLTRKVSVLAYDTQSAKIARINSWDPEYAELYVWEAAVATASAPTYFPGFTPEGFSFVDGGLFAGSPAKEGHKAAIKQTDEPIYLLNIGTGYQFFKAITGTWGLLNWMYYKGINPITTFIFQAQKQSDHEYLKDLDEERDATLRFRTIDTELNSGIGMDTTDRELLEALYELGINEDVSQILLDLE